MIFSMPDGGQLMLLVASFSSSRQGIDMRPADVVCCRQIANVQVLRVIQFCSIGALH